MVTCMECGKKVRKNRVLIVPLYSHINFSLFSWSPVVMNVQFVESALSSWFMSSGHKKSQSHFSNKKQSIALTFFFFFQIAVFPTTDLGVCEMVAAKKETKKTGDSAVKKRKQQEESSSAVAARTTDEFNFPRGGASVLTPLEHKEISRKADEDVLFSVN